MNADLLARCALFAGLAPDALQRHCPGATLRTFEHAQTIYAQGQPCRELFCVLSGQVKLARVNRAGDEFTIGLRVPGDLFGSALLGAAQVEADDSAVAKGRVLVWAVPQAEFRDLLLHQPALCLRVADLLAQRQRQTERRLECLALKRTEARLAKTLRELSGGFEARCEHGFGLHIRLSQQELAHLVGASRQVVSTILNRLREQGVLGYNREYVCVRSIDAIETLIGD